MSRVPHTCHRRVVLGILVILGFHGISKLLFLGVVRIFDSHSRYQN